MPIPVPFYSQYECRNETLEVYASDRRGKINYFFNNFGYRNNIDYHDQESNVGIYIGSSITSGIGIKWEESFATKSSQALGSPCYHFAQGCMMIDNQEILRLLREVLDCDLNPKYVVIQFINLNRRYNYKNGCVELVHDTEENIMLFHRTFTEIEKLLKNQTWCFMGIDNTSHDVGEHIIKHPRCLSWNPKFIDFAGVGEHPGTKWHQMIAAGIVKNLQNQLS